MTTGKENFSQPDEQFSVKMSDNLENLYIGRINQVIGLINNERQVSLKGEVLLYGRIEGNIFVVEQLRRLALYGALLQPPDEDRIGIISLAGPLTYPELVFDPDSKAGNIYNLNLQLHYRALSTDGPDSLEEAIFPRVEVLTANLTWVQDTEPTEQEVKLNIGLPTSDLTRKWLGLIQTIAFEPILLSFYPPGTEPSDQNGTHNSLQNCMGAPTTLCTGSNLGRLLPLKFINLSRRKTPAELQTLEKGCQKQIKGVCEVWRNKAALGLTLDPQIQPPGQIQQPGLNLQAITTQAITTDKAAKLRPSGTPTHIRIYLVNEFNYDINGGGDTKDGGQASAYCMLQESLLADPSNKYLLAHELGHVLGISGSNEGDVIGYPTAKGVIGVYIGSVNSVMQAGINSSRNTSRNMQIFTTYPSNANPVANMTPLNAIVSAATWCDNFRPDGP